MRNHITFHQTDCRQPGSRRNGQMHVASATLMFVVWLLVASSPRAHGQGMRSSDDGLWRPVSAEAFDVNRLRDVAAPGDFAPASYRMFALDANLLERLVERAPSELAARTESDESNLPRITIPMPDGSFQRFELIESPVMSKALAAKFPQIRSFRGRGIDNRLLSMRLDVSPRGLRAQVLSPEGTVIVDPLPAGNRYMSFNKRVNRAPSQPFRCLVEGRTAAAFGRAAPAMAFRSGENLRTYRLAVACTGEYARHFGGTAADAMAAINTTVNRVTGIYEREVAIRLELVDNNDQLLFTDPLADPFTNDNANVLINQSQSVIDSRIGNANYDIGHTLSTGAGGLAGLGVVGVTGQKARGVTGRANPVGDPFDVDYVAHEMGHQFGGDHTFNGQVGSCSGFNRNAATAVEPGGGSTIQAYAGICGSDNLQANSDPYFHSVSLDQIIAFSTTGSGNVAPPQPTGNSPPSVNGGPDFTIPRQTSFRLTAAGSDPDGDPLLYCWEQRDLGPAAGLSQPDNGQIPLFRSFNPTTEPSRVFPRWPDILNQTTTLGEQLPSKSRTMNFRVTARDNRSGGGGVSTDDVTIHVEESAGPFEVIEPSSSSIPSNLIEVRWNVASTDQTPIDCNLVNIRLSTDGGQTFAEVLAANTANDGKELVAIPAAASQNLRIMVESADNVFFAVSPVNFSVQTANVRIFVVRHAEKEEGSDPNLTPTGHRRAQDLAALMARAGVTNIYATDFRRTQQTAEPTAVAAGVSVTSYSDETELVDQIKALSRGERALVVGHSNTIERIVTLLGVSQSLSIGEDDFDNLYYVGLAAGQPVFAHFTQETPRVDVPSGPQVAVTESRSRSFAPPVVEREGVRSVDISPSSEFAARAVRAAVRMPLDRFAKSDLPVFYLQQNWTPEESIEFYRLRQGSPIMRKVFFNALEQPDETELFRESEYLASFGFLPQRPHSRNPEGYPIGFGGNDALEISCAACHTSKLIFAGQEYRIDGSQAMTDVESWLAELVRAIEVTLADAPELANADPRSRLSLDQGTKFGRFAARLLNTTAPRVAQVRIVHSLLQRDYERRQRYNDFNDYGRQLASDSQRATAEKHEAYGFGRLDALGAILNQACAETLDLAENAAAANAPVNYPAIWDAPQHTHVQWNGAVDNTARFGPLGRNAGQVVGVFGLVETEGTLVGYNSSINFDAIERAEELVTKLWSPKWPEEFGLDQSKVADGEEVYRSNCITCHALLDRTDPNRRVRDVLVPISRRFGPYGVLGTDSLAAQNWIDRTARVGRLAGRDKTLPFGDEFPPNADARVPARDILSHVVFNAIARSFVPWRDELTLEDAGQRSVMLAAPDATDTLSRYKSRPLNGVWSTAPYLHNGSVQDMAELLTAPEQRKTTFRVGTVEFNPATLGFQDDGPFEFDTTKPGNSNSGHAYGTDLSAGDKASLFEFLKTL